MDSRLVDKLDFARSLAKVPFIITQGRPGLHSPSSITGAHPKGLAVDIACTRSHDRMKMVAAAIIAGFKRIGVYDRHIHLDIDETLPQEVLWWGKSKS